MDMEYSIKTLRSDKVSDFFPVFSYILEQEFPIYEKNTVRYFLNKVYPKINFVYWIDNGLKTVLIAQSQSQIIGFAVIDEPYGGVSLCRWLGVLSNYQKKGIGTALVKAWITLAINAGCHKIELASQPKAKEFYEKAGLVLEGMRKLSYFGSDQYVFGKIIGTPNETMIKK